MMAPLLRQSPDQVVLGNDSTNEVVPSTCSPPDVEQNGQCDPDNETEMMQREHHLRDNDDTTVDKMPMVASSDALLNDVLTELERERKKREEVEEELHALRLLGEGSGEGVASPSAVEEEVEVVRKDVEEEVGDSSEAKSKAKLRVGGALLGNLLDRRGRNSANNNNNNNNINNASSSSNNDQRHSERHRNKKLRKHEQAALVSSLLRQVEDLRGQLDAGSALWSNTESRLRREFLTLQSQRDGLFELVEALTEGNSALKIAAAAEEEGELCSSTSSLATTNTLPLHAVRMLEMMPWDPKARDLAVGVEEIYEWQVYDQKSRSWSHDLRHFPRYFRSLPVTKPAGDSKDKNNKHRTLPKGCVVTNQSCTNVLDMEEGYALPNRGSWEWVGGWRVDTNEDGVVSDELGWTYSTLPKHLVSREATECHESAGVQLVGRTEQPLRNFRRRRWTRQRVLVSYPSVSERTKHYLSLVAQNASLNLSVAKLTDQVLDVRQKLTETEAELDHLKKQVESDAIPTSNKKEKDNWVGRGVLSVSNGFGRGDSAQKLDVQTSHSSSSSSTAPPPTSTTTDSQEDSQTSTDTSPEPNNLSTPTGGTPQSSLHGIKENLTNQTSPSSSSATSASSTVPQKERFNWNKLRLGALEKIEQLKINMNKDRDEGVQEEGGGGETSKGDDANVTDEKEKVAEEMSTLSSLPGEPSIELNHVHCDIDGYESSSSSSTTSSLLSTGRVENGKKFMKLEGDVEMEEIVSC